MQKSFFKLRSRKPCKLFYLCNNIARNLEKIKVLKWKSMIWQKLYSKSFKSRYVRHLMDSHLIIARSSNALGAGSSKIIMLWNDFWRSIVFLRIKSTFLVNTYETFILDRCQKLDSFISLPSVGASRTLEPSFGEENELSWRKMQPNVACWLQKYYKL